MAGGVVREKGYFSTLCPMTLQVNSKLGKFNIKKFLIEATKKWICKDLPNLLSHVHVNIPVLWCINN